MSRLVSASRLRVSASCTTSQRTALPWSAWLTGIRTLDTVVPSSRSSAVVTPASQRSPPSHQRRPGGGLPASAAHSTSTSAPEVATRDPLNGEDSPGSLKWTEVGGAENIIHEFHWFAGHRRDTRHPARPVQNCPFSIWLSGERKWYNIFYKRTFDHWFLLAQYLHWKW